MNRTTARVFVTGRSQAVRLPKAFRFDCDEVFIERQGDKVILSPKPKSWADYFATSQGFSEDFPDHIEELPMQERESF